jgi:hypothetical protein
MAEDQPGPPGSSNHDDRPGQRPTEPLGGPAQPPASPPAYGQPGGELRSPAPTAPLPGGPSAAPAFAAAGPPREALAGFWRRLVAAFLDWILVGIVAAAIGRRRRGPVPVRGNWPVHSGRARLLHLLPRHQRRPVDRQQDHGDPGAGCRHRPPPALCPGVRPGAREQPVRTAVLPRVLLDAVGTPQADLARFGRQQPGRQGQRLSTWRVRPPRALTGPLVESGAAALHGALRAIDPSAHGLAAARGRRRHRLRRHPSPPAPHRHPPGPAAPTARHDPRPSIHEDMDSVATSRSSRAR